MCYKFGGPSLYPPMPRIHDVTVPLAPGMLAYPGDPPFQLEPVQRLGEAPCNLSRMVLTTHAGTHVDAPAHFLAEGTTVDHLPLEILLGKARVVELLSRERVERVDLEALDLSDDLRVLLKTRMSGQMLKPGYQEDHVSIDRFGSADFPAHHALLEAGVVVVEGLDLSEVEPWEYDMACLPLRVCGGDAAPARVVLRSRA